MDIYIYTSVYIYVIFLIHFVVLTLVGLSVRLEFCLHGLGFVGCLVLEKRTEKEL